MAAAALLFGCAGTEENKTADCGADVPGFVLSDDLAQVKIGEDGSLLVLSNAETGPNYASGQGLWRMFYNTHEEKEMQIDGSENTPAVSQEGNADWVQYLPFRLFLALVQMFAQS